MRGGRARYAVIGSPIAHSLSPVMHQAAFDAMRIDATYEAIESDTNQVRDVFRRLLDQGYAGWNVTTPLKEAAMNLLDRTTADAAAARAVNTVRAEADGTLTGHNTDGDGFMRALRELWPQEPAGTVLILGTGPAARAVAIALRAGGSVSLACWSRDARRAAQIAPPLLGATPSLVVSALPADATVPPDIVESARDDTVIFDLNYGRSQSPIGAMRGERRSNGLPMLLHQGALSFEWWTGLPAPLAQMRAALSL